MADLQVGTELTSEFFRYTLPVNRLIDGAIEDIEKRQHQADTGKNQNKCSL